MVLLKITMKKKKKHQKKTKKKERERKEGKEGEEGFEFPGRGEVGNWNIGHWQNQLCVL